MYLKDLQPSESSTICVSFRSHVFVDASRNHRLAGNIRSVSKHVGSRLTKHASRDVSIEEREPEFTRGYASQGGRSFETRIVNVESPGLSGMVVGRVRKRTAD